MIKQFYVEVVAYYSNEVIKRLGPLSKSKADKVEAGININLDHERYFTRQVEATKEAA